jgi:plasmid stabilization system protein ParE
MKRLIIGSAAELEYTEAIQFYDSRREGLGLAFVEEVEVAAGAIRRHPKSGLELVPGIRRKLLAKFPYALIYEEIGEEILVLAVAHLHRRPGYWLDRL